MSRSNEAPVIVGLGELLWDRFPDSRRPGGAPANVAYHATQLGGRGIVCSRVGDDEPGRALLALLAERGLETRYVQRDPARPTGSVTVDVAERDRPQYTIHEGVAWDELRWGEELDALAGGAAAICFGTLAQRCETTRETIHRMLEAAVGAGALVVYDVNLRPPFYRREWIERSLGAARFVKLNLDEVAELVRLFGLEGAAGTGAGGAVAALAVHLRERFGVEATCVTRAEEGCLLFAGDRVFDVAGERVETEDAVGAGDAFTAAWITATLRGWPAGRAVRFANRIGAMVASRAGAMPRIASEAKEIMAEMARETDA